MLYPSERVHEAAAVRLAEYECFNGGPIVAHPSKEEFRLMLVQSMMRASIAREIEHDADVIWQMLLKTDNIRDLSVQEADDLCKWWFAKGYSEHVHRRAAELTETEQ